MILLQLNPPIPVDTPKGQGFAFGWLDYGQEHDCLWKVCVTTTGEWWDVPQPQVRGVENVSMGRSVRQTESIEDITARIHRSDPPNEMPFRFMDKPSKRCTVPWRNGPIGVWFSPDFDPRIDSPQENWTKIEIPPSKGTFFPSTRYIEQSIVRAIRLTNPAEPPIRFIGHRKSLSDIPWMHCEKRLADWFGKGLSPGTDWVRIDYFAPKGWIDPANDQGPLTD